MQSQTLPLILIGLHSAMCPSPRDVLFQSKLISTLLFFDVAKLCSYILTVLCNYVMQHEMVLNWDFRDC